MVAVGFTLQPEREYCGLLEPLFVEDADYFEVTPETTWVRDGDEPFRPNGWGRPSRLASSIPTSPRA